MFYIYRFQFPYTLFTILPTVICPPSPLFHLFKQSSSTALLSYLSFAPLTPHSP
ncbi:hypothetical protein HMPREF9969_2175 [Prevotella sp. oral taxon 306 str. F0472]|nr:hypothetical protein HMPREF9969_2175 [Prevotella sp. oral taxon 306 str. F0472]